MATIDELFNPDGTEKQSEPPFYDQIDKLDGVLADANAPGPAEPREPTLDDVLAGLPFAYLSGPAGTGKTWMARELVKERDDAILAATTGIAAVNLGEATTINSLLSYFDTQSLQENYANGFLQYRLRSLRRSGVRLIVLDEVSMLDADQLTVLCQAFDELDQKKSYDEDLGEVTWSANEDQRMKLLLVGDFAQLPPVKAAFAFESPEWSRFQAHTFQLTTIRRQGDQEFVKALQAVRKGQAQVALPILEPRIVPSLDFTFPGTTIVAKNDAVDRINGMRHAKLPGALCQYATQRVGAQQTEWVKHIPEVCEVKVGSLVMILMNKPLPRLEDEPLVSFDYVNGDLGTVLEQTPHGIKVFLHRTLEEKVVTPVVKEWKEPTGKKNPRWTIKGSVTYMPLRLAWATTVHKSQGLSLDQVQVSVVDPMFARPGMLYVALSRCRTLEGLRIVGNARMIAGRCGVEQKIKGWL